MLMEKHATYLTFEKKTSAFILANAKQCFYTHKDVIREVKLMIFVMKKFNVTDMQ